LPIGIAQQQKVLGFPLNQFRWPLPDGWRGSGAPRRPERLVPIIFLLEDKQAGTRRGAGGEPRQDPSGISVGKFGDDTLLDGIRDIPYISILYNRLRGVL